MGEIDNLCAEVFLKEQLKLLPKKVAEDLEESKEFLLDCMAMVFSSKNELLKFIKEEDIDLDDAEDVEELLEVFVLPDGRYLYVEA